MTVTDSPLKAGPPSRPPVRQGAFALKAGLASTLKYASLVGACLVMLVPLVVIVLNSLKTSEEAADANPLAPPGNWLNFDNYVTAFTDPSFLRGVRFVVLFALVLIPVQMFISLALALVLDALTTKFAKFSRLMIFLPYAIPAVIGALMWGFLYSPTFGPMQQLFGLFGAQAPFLLSPDNVFVGLMNVVTWQWAGYYMIIIFAALQGIDSSIYEAAKIDGANAWQIAFRIKVPMVASALTLILVFALIGTLQFFTEPQILRLVSNGTITPDFTPNVYAFSQAFAYANFNYASAISFALGMVVFIAVYIFLFFTRKRGSVFS